METAIAETGVTVRATLHGLFDVQASATPNAVALIDGPRRTTYSTLALRVAECANDLTQRGLQRGDRVVVCARRGPELIALLLGVMKAGGVSVPVDVDLPMERRRQILADAAPALIATTDEQGRLGYTAVTPPRADAGSRADAAVERDGLEDVWCLLYTSGVTGKPKGVRVTHTQVIALLSWMWESFPFRPGDVSLLHTSPMMIASAWDYFGPLLQGVPGLVLAGQDTLNPALVLRQCIEHGVTHVSASPGLWQALLDRPASELSRWTALRIGMSRGDQLRADLARSWMRTFPEACLLNAYGSTECWRPTMFDTTRLPADADRVPIGRPLPGVSVHVCDEALREVKTGEVGELCVAGVCVGPGYHNLPELTAERFVANPFGNRRAMTLFRTGDLGRRNEDGTLVVVGRNDQQVSIRGYRVELGDIESAIRRCSGIRDAVVVATRHASGAAALTAHVVPNDHVTVDVAALRTELAGYVPHYMIPATCVVTRTLPTTRSGKVDRLALIQQSADSARPTDARQGGWRSATEDQLEPLWLEIIGCDAIGSADGFLDLGGDSIMAMRLVGRISARFAVEISVDDLFANATIPQVAARIDAAHTDGTREEPTRGYAFNSISD